MNQNMNDEFAIVETGNNSVRLINSNGLQFGEYYQIKCRTPEWKASLIVFEKYKRKYNLSYQDLLNLREYMVSFCNDRKQLGKSISNDYMTQVASTEIKRVGDCKSKEIDFS